MEYSRNIFHKEIEQKHNKQLHAGEYSIEYSAYEQQLIHEVISWIFIEYSAEMGPGPSSTGKRAEYSKNIQ